MGNKFKSIIVAVTFLTTVMGSSMEDSVIGGEDIFLPGSVISGFQIYADISSDEIIFDVRTFNRFYKDSVSIGQLKLDIMNALRLPKGILQLRFSKEENELEDERLLDDAAGLIGYYSRCYEE